MRETFGPEYDRTRERTQSRRGAEAELAERQERREQLEIRPLGTVARNRYLDDWRMVQAQFVDNPAAAVVAAEGIIESAMAERGYPVEDFEQQAADVSVDHPDVVENYRQGRRLADSDGGGAPTESLQQAMRRYRMLFDALVDPDRDDDAAARSASWRRRQRVAR